MQSSNSVHEYKQNMTKGEDWNKCEGIQKLRTVRDKI